MIFLKIKNHKIDTFKKKVLPIISSWVIFLLVIVISVTAVFLQTPNENEKMTPGNIAMTIGNEKISVGMYNYYYTCVKNNYLSSAEYGYYDIDENISFDEQYIVDPDGNKKTWEEQFKEDTINQIQYVTAYYNEGLKEGIVVSEEQQTQIDKQLDEIKTLADDEGLSINDYLFKTYGKYCGVETVKKVLISHYIANNYYNEYITNLSISDREIEDFYNKNILDFYSVSAAVIQNKYDEKDKDAEIEKIKNITKNINNIDDLKANIKNICSSKIKQYLEEGYFNSEEECITAMIETLEMDVGYNNNSAPKDVVNWLFDDETKIGDCTFIDDKDNQVIYIVLKLKNKQIKDEEVYSVRHILISPNIENSDNENWEYAEEKANNILEKYKETDKSELSFAKLAELESDDIASISSGTSGIYGGLYEGIKKNVMNSNFENWALNQNRKYGDVDIIKTEYGYHVMFFIKQTTSSLFQCEKRLISEKEKDLINTYTVKIK